MGEGYLKKIWKWSQRNNFTAIWNNNTGISYLNTVYTMLPNGPVSSEYYKPAIKYNCFKMIYYNVHFYVHVFIK